MTSSCYAPETAQLDTTSPHSAQSFHSSKVGNAHFQKGSRHSLAKARLSGKPAKNCGELDDIVEHAQQIIWDDRNIGALNVHEVARQLPVTRRTLDRRFAEKLGRTVLDEINRSRLFRAMSLLAETDLLIKTVSYMAGFPSRERMRLAFLNDHGMTPSEYRERMR